MGLFHNVFLCDDVSYRSHHVSALIYFPNRLPLPRSWSPECRPWTMCKAILQKVWKIHRNPNIGACQTEWHKWSNSSLHENVVFFAQRINGFNRTILTSKYRLWMFKWRFMIFDILCIWFLIYQYCLLAILLCHIRQVHMVKLCLFWFGYLHVCQISSKKRITLILWWIIGKLQFYRAAWN